MKNGRTLFLTFVASILMTIEGGMPSSIDAAEIAVNTETDELNSDLDCSLREAIRSANLDMAVDGCTAGSGADVITLEAKTYLLSVGPAGDDAAMSGDLDIDNGDLTINGAGAPSTVIDGGGIDRVFHFDPFGAGTFTIVLSDLTVRNGNAGAGNGGGIFKNGSAATFNNVVVTENTTTGEGCGIYSSGGTLILNDSVVSDNTGTCINAGGIRSSSDLELNRSIVSGNISTAGSAAGGIKMIGSSNLAAINSTVSRNEGQGMFATGGIDGSSGDMFLLRSTVSGNTGGGNGGGVEFTGNSLVITNSTISGNTAGNVGGGLRFDGTVGELNNATISDNTANASLATFDGGGVYINAGTLTARNSLIAGNRSDGGGPDCRGTLTSAGYNLIQDTTDCTIVGEMTGNITGEDPLLAALDLNGGLTATHPLLAGSPAIDAGNPAGCADDLGTGLTEDQRGFTRPVGAACDIGAYEVGACGDGVTDSATGEECDDGAANSDTTADACRTTCVAAACGDGVADTGEGCDDDNTADGDGCSATCAVEEGSGDGGGCSLVPGAR